MLNPAIRAAGQDITIVLFDGTAETVRGTIGLFETSTGEAAQAFAEAGPIAWIDYAGDGQKIEFLEYTDKASGDRLHRRKIKAERIGTVFPVVKVHLVSEATVMPALRGDYSARDFDPRDFNTGTP